MSCPPLDYSQVSLLWGVVSPSPSSGRLACQLWGSSLEGLGFACGALSGPSSAITALSPSVSGALRPGPGGRCAPGGALKPGPSVLPQSWAFQRGDGALLCLVTLCHLRTSPHPEILLLAVKMSLNKKRQLHCALVSGMLAYFSCYFFKMYVSNQFFSKNK